MNLNAFSRLKFKFSRVFLIETVQVSIQKVENDDSVCLEVIFLFFCLLSSNLGIYKTLSWLRMIGFVF